MATCMDNVTDMRVPDGEAEFSKSVTSYVCQSIIVPSDVMGYKTIVSSQPVSLADRVVGRCCFPGLGMRTGLSGSDPALSHTGVLLGTWAKWGALHLLQWEEKRGWAVVCGGVSDSTQGRAGRVRPAAPVLGPESGNWPPTLLH